MRTITPTAIVHRTQRCEIGADEIMDRRAFDLDRILAIEPDFLSDDAHEHDEAVKSVALRVERPLDARLFDPWISGLLREQGQNILRSKGILSFAGNPKRFVFQGVHMLMEGDDGKPWGSDEARCSKLVFIGRDLDAAALKAGFEACRAR